MGPIVVIVAVIGGRVRQSGRVDRFAGGEDHPFKFVTEKRDRFRGNLRCIVDISYFSNMDGCYELLATFAVKLVMCIRLLAGPLDCAVVCH